MHFEKTPSKSLSQLQLKHKARAPGRINLIGEHTDYNGGKVLPFAMNLAIDFKLFVSQEQSSSFATRYEISSEGHDGVLVLERDELSALVKDLSSEPQSEDLRLRLPKALADSWARYALGALVWHQKSLQGQGITGKSPALVHIQVSSQLPPGAGISSSAALCTGLLALLRDYDHLELSDQDLARQAMFIEHQFAGTRCGLMDQLAIVLGKPGRLLLIDFKDLASSGALLTKTIKAHANFDRYRPVLINTQVKHELGSSPYNERRRHCELGLLGLRQATGAPYPSLGYFAADQEFLRNFAPDLSQSTLKRNLYLRVFPHDEVLAKRLAHAIMENIRVDAAVKALETGDFMALREAIDASHLSLRDDYEVSCSELDLIRLEAINRAGELAEAKSLKDPPILGSRMTGGGFGGSTIQLVHEMIVEDFAEAMRSQQSGYALQTGLTPVVLLTEFSAGLSHS